MKAFFHKVLSFMSYLGKLLVRMFVKDRKDKLFHGGVVMENYEHIGTTSLLHPKRVVANSIEHVYLIAAHSANLYAWTSYSVKLIEHGDNCDVYSIQFTRNRSTDKFGVWFVDCIAEEDVSDEVDSSISEMLEELTDDEESVTVLG